MIPPLGPIFLAWGDDQKVDRWLDSLAPDDDEAERQHNRQALAKVRERGFSVGLESGARTRSGRALMELVEDPRDDRLRGRARSLIAAMRHDYQVVDLDSTDKVLVSNMAAPVFGSDGEVVMALTLQGFAQPMNGAEIHAVADQLLSTTRQLTRESGGHAPDGYLDGQARSVARA